MGVWGAAVSVDVPGEALVALAEALDGQQPPCQVDPEAWFPVVGDDDEDLAAVVRACERDCPAAVECLAYARAIGADVGVWGGVLLGRAGREKGAAA